ncbi:hypothetical protein EAF04_010844 [Stromatinia cepivora]|nr:hypothetical protein EAF04_010844 [Stromatinia cepivora]
MSRFNRMPDMAWSGHRIHCRFDENQGLCPVPTTPELLKTDASRTRPEMIEDFREVFPPWGIRRRYFKGEIISLAVKGRSKNCKLCEHEGGQTPMGETPGDFCLDCVPIARDWSPSWCWQVGREGHRFPNGQCDVHVDNSQAIFNKKACSYHDQYLKDGEGKHVLESGGQRVKMEEFQRDASGEYTKKGKAPNVEDGVLVWEKVRIRWNWPENLFVKRESGAWYPGREKYRGTTPYPINYKWPNYDRIPVVSLPWV